MMLFELEDGPPDCIFDYFEIWKLPPRQTEWEPVLNRETWKPRYCGSHFPKDLQQVDPPGSKVKIIFHSDSSFSKRGFFMKMGAFPSKRTQYIPPGDYLLSDIRFMLSQDPIKNARADFNSGFDDFCDHKWPQGETMIPDNKNKFSLLAGSGKAL